MRTIRDIVTERGHRRECRAAALASNALDALHAQGIPAWLIGSLARGAFAAHSDIDILIDAEGETRDVALRTCLRALDGHPSSIVFTGDVHAHVLPQLGGRPPIDPVFAATKRRLQDLRREWERLREAKQLLRNVNDNAGPAGAKSWVTSAALSAGVSGLHT